MRYMKVLLLTLFFFVSMIFFIQNTAALSELMVLELDILGLELVSKQLPFYLIVLISFVAGAIFSLAYFLSEKLRLAKEFKAAKAKLAALEQEVNSLRNLPLETQTYPAMSRDKDEDNPS